jgi:hypothetical protein
MRIICEEAQEAEKEVNQCRRDFKMLYRRVNGTFVDANDSHEVVKVC